MSLGFLAAFAVLTILLPDAPESQSERRLLAKRPALSLSSVADGSFMSGFEKYMLDQFPLRDSFRTLKATTGCIPSGSISQSLISRQTTRPLTVPQVAFGMCLTPISRIPEQKHICV